MARAARLFSLFIKRINLIKDCWTVPADKRRACRLPSVSVWSWRQQTKPLACTFRIQTWYIAERSYFLRLYFMIYFGRLSFIILSGVL